MPFCPSCKYEYLPGVAVCPDCNVTLVDFLSEAAGDSADENRTDVDLVELPPFSGMVFAEMLKEIFEQEGIPCIIRKHPLAASHHAFGTSIPGFQATILVAKQHFDNAVRIMREVVGDHSKGESL